jgi:rhamnose transport system ATP-binding protein
VDWRARRQTAAALLGEVGVPIDPDRLVSTLSMPEQQIVEIAKALGLNARVLIMDEPSAALSAREVSRLIEIVRRLCGRGTAVVYISHRLDEVYTLADRITVLRDGRSMATRGTAALSRTELVALMVGRDMEPAAPVRATTRGDVVLDVRDLSSGVHVGPVSFSVHRGEIVGLAGLVGSGRTELAETLFNVRPKDAGRVSVDGALVGGRDPSSAVQARLAYVPEDRRHHGVIGGMTIAANTTLASLARVSRAGVVDRSAERALTTEYMRRLGTKATSPDVAVETLSGGNQQKVAVARWLATDPAVLILDEPTQGVDVGAKAEIHAMIRDLAARGLGVLVISSDLPEVLSLSDRVLVMRNGRIAGELDRDTATPERVMDFALHGGAGARSSEASA